VKLGEMRGGDLNFRPFALAADFLRRFRQRLFQKRRMTGRSLFLSFQARITKPSDEDDQI